jgi:hypothetical protein
MPGSWRDAAEGRAAAGLVVEVDYATLHTCSLGLQELYVRRAGGALYFAVRIAPLLAVDDFPTHTDWNAWASALAFFAPIGDATPFREIRRAVAATGWRAGAGGRLEEVRFVPSWLLTEPDRQIEATELVEVIRAHLPRPQVLRRIALTLSGGWDSRLLGALAAQNARRRMIAWTTSPDDGTDRDVALSRPVATVLGMEHRVVLPDSDAWRAARERVLDRVQHQTPLHTWLMPLASKIHSQREPLLDGLVGDVLLHPLLVDERVLEASSPQERRDELRARLSGGRLKEPNWYAPGVASRLEDASRAAFDDAVAHLDDYPAAAIVGVMLTRTARATAASPLRLFAPETDVRLPFVHPAVIEAGLRVPTAAKLGGDLFRQLLRAAGPAVADLPSTNDRGQTHPRVLRRQTEPAALGRIAADIAADPVVRGLLGRDLLPAVTDPEERRRICAYNGPRSVLQWASMLAHWRAKYSAVLASDEP